MKKFFLVFILSLFTSTSLFAEYILEPANCTFKKKTNCPVLVNTSFNVRGEPIVNTPLDAFNCFMGTDLEKLAIGNCYLDKDDQDPLLKKDYTNEFELD